VPQHPLVVAVAGRQAHPLDLQVGLLASASLHPDLLYQHETFLHLAIDLVIVWLRPGDEFLILLFS
jgi:hypothetical protein